MQRVALALIVVLIIVLGVLGCLISQANGLQAYRDAIEEKWQAYVQAAGLRDPLVQGLFDRCESAGSFENGCLILTGDPNAPASVLGNPAEARAFAEQMDRLGRTLERFLSAPESASVADLSPSLRGATNRVDVARSQVNDSISVHNAQLEKFPTSVVAWIVGCAKVESM